MKSLIVIFNILILLLVIMGCGNGSGSKTFDPAKPESLTIVRWNNTDHYLEVANKHALNDDDSFLLRIKKKSSYSSQDFRAIVTAFPRLVVTATCKTGATKLVRSVSANDSPLINIRQLIPSLSLNSPAQFLCDFTAQITHVDGSSQTYILNDVKVCTTNYKKQNAVHVMPREGGRN